MRRWGRALKKSAESAVDLTTEFRVAVESGGDATFVEPVVCGTTVADCRLPPHEKPDSADVGKRKRDAVEDVATNTSTSTPSVFGSPAVATRIPIRPAISTSFQNKLRAGKKQAAVVPRPVHEANKPTCASACARDDAISETRAGTTLVWLRPFDLRLHDHPSFWYAAQRRRPVQVVFIWSDSEDAALGEWQIAGTAAAFWLHHALASLDASLKQRYGLGVAVRTGNTTASALLSAAQECAADEVVTSCAVERDGPCGRLVEAAASRALQDVGIKLHAFRSFLMYDIDALRVDLGTYRGHFGTLTPFHHACMAQPPVQRPTPEPPMLEQSVLQIRDEGLDALGFARMPVRSDGSIVDWGAHILESWDISEEAALVALRRFLARGGGLDRYEKGRQLADASAVTRISPYLRFGMLSCRLMFHEMKAAGAKEKSIVYWRRLVWRDLAYWQLSLFPRMRSEPIRAHYAGQAWNPDREALRRWQRGMTGYPIVDAGMRELWTTGWMAQNTRMVAAILLCEHLNIHWIEGERWFHHTLVDADSAINAMMWQNAGKSGLDQWNFTMSAVTAGKNQDPTGDYVRKWCPELAKLPLRYLHTPWDAPEHVLREAGVMLGPCGNYPERIVVDLKAAAKVSGDAIRNQRKRSLEWINDQGYDLIVLPRGSTVAHDGQKFRVFTVPQYRNLDYGCDAGRSGEERPLAAKGSRKGKGKGDGKGNSRHSQSARASAAAAGSHSSSSAVKSSQQSVLHDYMRASGG